MEAQLRGTWRLKSFAVEFENGTSTEPYGPTPVGLLHYAEDGHVFVHMMAANRPPLGSDTDMASGDAARIALGTHMSYCGRYAITGDSVEHLVSVCVMQEMVGETLLRTVSLSGDLLTLVAPSTTLSGQRGRAVLVWQKA